MSCSTENGPPFEDSWRAALRCSLPVNLDFVRHFLIFSAECGITPVFRSLAATRLISFRAKSNLAVCFLPAGAMNHPDYSESETSDEGPQGVAEKVKLLSILDSGRIIQTQCRKMRRWRNVSETGRGATRCEKGLGLEQVFWLESRGFANLSRLSNWRRQRNIWHGTLTAMSGIYRE